MNDGLANWSVPHIDFDWTAFWHEENRLSSFDEGPLARSYYQKDHEKRLIGLFDELVEEMPPSGRVLDVGCGNGAGAASLLQAADQQHRVLSVDMLDRAQVRPPQSLLQLVRIHRGDAEQLNFPDQMFDLVLSCFCAEFCNIMQVIRESHRVLKRGGRLALFLYARESPMVSIQSAYVNIYRKGLKQLLENAMAGQPTDAELVRQIRLQIEADDPRPCFRAHLEAMVEQLANRPRSSASHPVDLDEVFLPGVDDRPNIFSIRTLQRRMALWHAIDLSALDFHDGFALKARVEHTGFTDSYIIPAEFKSARIGYFQAGQRL